MRLRKLLRPLSAQEIREVAGAQNYDYVDPLPPTPVPLPVYVGPGGSPPRFVEV